jgi:hypothetical protein
LAAIRARKEGDRDPIASTLRAVITSYAPQPIRLVVADDRSVLILDDNTAVRLLNDAAPFLDALFALFLDVLEAFGSFARLLGIGRLIWLLTNLNRAFILRLGALLALLLVLRVFFRGNLAAIFILLVLASGFLPGCLAAVLFGAGRVGAAAL